MIKKDILINADCLQVMQDIPDNSIDCIICDQPYGVLNKRASSGKWDNVIPFEPLWEQYLRITKENAAIILFGSGMFTAKLMMSQPKLWRYNLIWDKVTRTGFLNSKKMPMRQHEDICVFYRKQPTYHPQMEVGKLHDRRRGSVKCNTYDSFQPLNVPPSNEYFPSSILRFSKGADVAKSYHPTVKPVALLRYLIRQYTDEGNVVLDNCMGSGSTCVAAVLEHRHFVGIELEEKYYGVACDRVLQAQSQLNLFD